MQRIVVGSVRLSMKKNIILVGGGGHCRSCIDTIEAQSQYEIVGIIDLPEKIHQKLLSYPVIGSDEDLEILVKQYNNFLVTVGQIRSSARRIELFEKIQRLGGRLPVVVSPKAYVSRHAEIGDGTIIMHNVVVNANAKIGKNCIINTGAIIEHDVVIEDNCHVSTGAIVNGGVVLQKNSFFGSGAVSREYITIGPNSFIKANSMVKVSDE
jgi:sugar O-acyltransferase (sialic acid O-acetyltransferase NeuD family)